MTQTAVHRTTGPRIRRMSERGRRWLVDLEGGCRTRAYLDSAGVPTIGVGQTYWPTKGRKRVEMGERLESVHAGLEMFARVLTEYEAAVDAATRDDITQEHFDAFTSLCYNIGAKAFTGSTAVRLYNQGQSIDAVTAALKRWNRAAGAVSDGLLERRECESDLMLYGAYRTQGARRAA